MKKKFFLLQTLFLLCPFFVLGNTTNNSHPNDSFQLELPAKGLFYNNIDLQVESINSFIKSGTTPIVITGLNIGYTNALPSTRIGLGAYYVNASSALARFINWNPLIETKVPNATVLNYNKKKVYLVLDQLQAYYFMPNIQFALFKTKWFDISANTAVGLGFVSKKTVDYFTNNEIPLVVKNKIVQNSQLFFPWSIGGVINFNLSSNVKVMGLGGYRLVLQTTGISEDFDGWYYQVGLKIKIFSVLKEIKKDWKDWKRQKKIKIQNK